MAKLSANQQFNSGSTQRVALVEDELLEPDGSCVPYDDVEQGSKNVAAFCEAYYMWAMIPILKELYPTHEEQSKKLETYYAFFNTDT